LHLDGRYREIEIDADDGNSQQWQAKNAS
jgi:hypothetical protein